MYSRFNPEARIAVMQAIDEARELGHSEVGPDHVLLGLLANVRGETYALLAAHGLHFDTARTIVVDRRAALADPPEVDADPTDASEASDSRDLDEDREALRAIGIDLDKVREAVRSTFGDDITAEWGERRPRGRGRGQGGGRRGRHHHPESGASDGGRGRRGPRSERFGDRAPFSPALRDALRATVHNARRGSADQDRRGPGGPQMSAGLLLLAIARSGDPGVDAVLGWADDSAALLAAIEDHAAQRTA